MSNGSRQFRQTSKERLQAGKRDISKASGGQLCRGVRWSSVPVTLLVMDIRRQGHVSKWALVDTNLMAEVDVQQKVRHDWRAQCMSNRKPALSASTGLFVFS